MKLSTRIKIAIAAGAIAGASFISGLIGYQQGNKVGRIAAGNEIWEKVCQQEVRLPDLACELVSIEYNKETDKYIVKYRRNPKLCATQIPKWTGIFILPVKEKDDGLAYKATGTINDIIQTEEQTITKVKPRSFGPAEGPNNVYDER